jgi:hypothetical protein
VVTTYLSVTEVLLGRGTPDGSSEALWQQFDEVGGVGLVPQDQYTGRDECVGKQRACTMEITVSLLRCMIK